MAKRKSLGQIAYEAYEQAEGFDPDYTDAKDQSHQWEAAAAAVELEVLRRLRESDRRRAKKSYKFIEMPDQ